MRPPGSPTRFRRPSIGAAPSPSSGPSGRWGRRIWARGCAPVEKAGGGVSPWFPTSTRPRRPRGCSGSFGDAGCTSAATANGRSTSMAARYGSAPARARAIPIPPMRRRRPKAPCSAVGRPARSCLPSPSMGRGSVDCLRRALDGPYRPDLLVHDRVLTTALPRPIDVAKHHTAADLLNNSIAWPTEEWSFNDTVGERTRRRGSRRPMPSSMARYDDAIGGHLPGGTTVKQRSLCGYP